MRAKLGVYLYNGNVCGVDISGRRPSVLNVKWVFLFRKLKSSLYSIENLTEIEWIIIYIDLNNVLQLLHIHIYSHADIPHVRGPLNDKTLMLDGLWATFLTVFSVRHESFG
jgi:hypothetical protein